MRIVVFGAAFLLAVTTFSSADDQLNDDVQRVKRVSVNVPSSDVDFDSNGKKGGKKPARFSKQSPGNGAIAFPIILPPYNRNVKPSERKPEWGSCLLYLESIAVTVFTEGKDPGTAVGVVDGGENNKNTYSVSDDDIHCITSNNEGGKGPKDFSFRLNINVGDAVKVSKVSEHGAGPYTISENFGLELKFTQKSDFSWRLTDVVATDLTLQATTSDKSNLVVSGSASNANRTKISSFTDYSYACSSTPATVWKVNENTAVGVSFGNIQLQPFGIGGKEGPKDGEKGVRFSNKVNDCVGLFSVGSWMGIIVALILLSVLSFGYLMVNSVQTMDRFDDPKQKQLIINAKE